MRGFRFALAFILVVVPTALAGATSPSPGTWQRLAQAPIAAHQAVSVWTGSQVLIFGREQPDPPWSADAAAAYTPSTDTWRRLAPFSGPTGNYEGRYSAVWTGKEMLIWGPGDRQAFNPATNRWRRLSRPPTAAQSAVGAGIVVWTGREMIGWGGGCCGDAFSDGTAYNPTTNTWRNLAPSPLRGSQIPLGAWTGRELIVFSGGGGAYNPATDSWRRIAPPPALPTDASVVWDGHEILVVGGSAPRTVSLAFDPATNRWRRLAPAPSGRARAAAVWAGKRLLSWGGTTSSPAGPKVVTPNQGLAYDPKTNRWSPLPGAPLLGRLDPVAEWTGHAMIVWGGQRPKTPIGTGERFFIDGAAFSPAGT